MNWLVVILYLLGNVALCNPRAIKVIKAGYLIHPAHRTIEKDRWIWIKEKKISRISPPEPIPGNIEVMDWSAFYVMPGLIDAHTHLCATLSKKNQKNFLLMHQWERPAYRALLAGKKAEEMLRAGFTTVRDLGNAGDYIDVDLKSSIMEGWQLGPRLLVAGKIISPHGGQYRELLGKEEATKGEYLFADTRDEIRKAVRENAYHGVDWIKVVVDAQKYSYSQEDLTYLVKEAQAAQLRVAAHAQTQQGAQAAVLAQVDSIEHGWKLTEAEFVLMQRSEIPLVSTDFPVSVLKQYGWSDTDALRIHQNHIRRLRQAHQAEVSLVFGSDLMIDLPGQGRGKGALDYFKNYIEAGVPNWEALQAATTTAAKLLGLQKTIGQIEPAFDADLIALARNPVEDLRHLTTVQAVIARGNLVPLGGK